MKKIILIALITVSAFACMPPMKPMPPMGCNYNNAMLMNDGNRCYWVYVNCGF